MTPEEKIYQLQIALRNSLSSIRYIRDMVDPIMKYNQAYQMLLRDVEYIQKQAEHVLQMINQEEKGEQ